MWRLRGVEEEAGGGQGEAGGGRGLSGARHASPLFVLLVEEEEDKGEEVGWAARWGSWAGWWAARVRPGRLCSFLFFCSVYLYLFYFATILNFKIIQQCQKLL